MATVPDAYYQFVMDYAPYAYVIPGSGPDPAWGRTAFAAAFAINFLHQAYNDPQYASKQTEIYSKMVSLADWLLTQQSTEPAKKAYGGFKSTETSNYYYSVDAARVIPALIQAHELTGTASYLNSAILAGATFLYSMQHPPTPTVHDKYYGGFARAVTDTDAWLPEMDIESLYGLIGLKILINHDAGNKTKYETMISEAADFLRVGFENLHMEYRPLPSGDCQWHRIGLGETQVYDDSFAYALLGLYYYEDWSPTVERVYNFINTIRASAEHAAYNPAICWAGYIDVVKRFPACGYYDAVTSGILWRIRRDRDKSSLDFSMKIIDRHQGEFMYWGVKHEDYSPVESKQALATVAWLSLLYLNFEQPITRFTQILSSKGENLVLYPVREQADAVSYGESVDIKAIVSPVRADEVLIEPGYIINDYLTVHFFAPIRHHDKIRRKGVDYEILDIQEFDFNGETMYRRAVCRRLVGA